MRTTVAEIEPHRCARTARLSERAKFLVCCTPRLGSTWEETMIRLLISVALALAVAETFGRGHVARAASSARTP